jgi:hypothetical protein
MVSLYIIGTRYYGGKPGTDHQHFPMWLLAVTIQPLQVLSCNLPGVV